MITIKAKWCGLPPAQNQLGRKFKEICSLHKCICKEER